MDRAYKDELTESEKSEFLQLIEQSPELKEDYNFHVNLLDYLKIQETTSLKKSLKEIHRNSIDKGPKSNFYFLFSVAAVIFIVVISAYFIYPEIFPSKNISPVSADGIDTIVNSTKIANASTDSLRPRSVQPNSVIKKNGIGNHFFELEVMEINNLLTANPEIGNTKQTQKRLKCTIVPDSKFLKYKFDGDTIIFHGTMKRELIKIEFLKETNEWFLNYKEHRIKIIANGREIQLRLKE